MSRQGSGGYTEGLARGKPEVEQGHSRILGLGGGNGWVAALDVVHY